MYTTIQYNTYIPLYVLYIEVLKANSINPPPYNKNGRWFFTGKKCSPDDVLYFSFSFVFTACKIKNKTATADTSRVRMTLMGIGTLAQEQSIIFFGSSWSRSIL